MQTTVLGNTAADTGGKEVVAAEMGTFAGMGGLQESNADDIEANKMGKSNGNGVYGGRAQGDR